MWSGKDEKQLCLKGGFFMATSSIFESVKITDPKVAQSFIDALESSEKAPKRAPSTRIVTRMATPEDTKRLRELRRQKRGNNA